MRTALTKLYFLERSLLERSFRYATLLLEASWLSVLDTELAHAIDAAYYDAQPAYREDDHNLGGLYDWEQEAIGAHFPPGGRLLVAGAGGGREVIALERGGFQIDAFECNAALVRAGNDLLRRLQLSSRIALADRDRCVDTDARYDGIVLGCDMYMLIPGRERRVAFLSSLRRRVRRGAPMLLSFFTRDGNTAGQRLARVVNWTRRALRKAELPPGDRLAPNLVHLFTNQELRDELRSGGFALELYTTERHGHAVACAE